MNHFPSLARLALLSFFISIINVAYANNEQPPSSNVPGTVIDNALPSTSDDKGRRDINTEKSFTTDDRYGPFGIDPEPGVPPLWNEDLK